MSPTVFGMFGIGDTRCPRAAAAVACGGGGGGRGSGGMELLLRRRLCPDTEVQLENVFVFFFANDAKIRNRSGDGEDETSGERLQRLATADVGGKRR